MKRLIGFLIFTTGVLGQLAWGAPPVNPGKGAAPVPSAPAVATPEAAKTTSPPPEEDVNYKYEARGRRDPFKALDVVSTFQTSQAPIVRPPGLKGQLIVEIRLVGIVQTPNGMLAMTQGYKNRTYFLHPNDALYDGKVLDIRKDGVVFLQVLKDTEGKTSTQQVVKKLQQTRGEGR
jgi:hypothetical protein